MSLESFKNRTLGGSFGNPKTNTFVGQCVSYARLYMESELGINTYPNGDAKDYWNNKISTDNFDKVGSPQNGDVVVYGAVSGNPYGHIGIYYNGQLLSQNLNVPLHVTIYGLNGAGNRLGYLRKKGGNPGGGEVITREQADSMFVELTGRHGSKEELDHFTGMPYWDAFMALTGRNPEHQKQINKDIPTREQANNMYFQLVGRNGTDEELNHATTISMWELFQGLTGKNPDFIGNKNPDNFVEVTDKLYKKK